MVTPTPHDSTKSDKTDSDGRRCPLAGLNQSWASYERDLKLWSLQCSLDKTAIGAHIVNRGFTKNPTFVRFIDLLDLDELGKETGFKYLCTKMGELTKELDPHLKL